MRIVIYRTLSYIDFKENRRKNKYIILVKKWKWDKAILYVPYFKVF